MLQLLQRRIEAAERCVSQLHPSCRAATAIIPRNCVSGAVLPQGQGRT